jgi:ABC-2 type transport system ATP-binding protein
MIMEDSYAISLKNIRKVFGKTVIFEDVNLDVPAGGITGISGPNGAGKSILLRIICGLVTPTQGDVYVLGNQVGVTCEFPPDTGALIDSPGLLADESAKKNLEQLAKISRGADDRRIHEVLKIVGLDPNDRRPVRVYSNGMRKRLGIAQAILEKPKVLILDEPTDAIDQAGWKDVYEYLIQLKEEGTTILFSSNNLDEIAILCDQAYVLQERQLKPVTI